MSEVNESTAEIPSSDTIELAGGDSPVSFDDLETMHRVHDEKNAEEKPAKKEAKAEAKAPKKESGEGPDAGKSKKADDGEGGEEADDEELVEEKDSKQEKPAKEEKPARTVKVKNGEEDLELAVSTMVPVKVKGVEQEVSLDELRNNYAGKVAWSEEFSKLGTQKQKFTQEREFVVGQLKEIFSLSQKDGVASLMKMAELSGLDPLKWRQDFMKVLLPQLENFMSMSEDERNAVETQFEKDYWKQQAESQSKAKQEEEGFKSFQAHVTQLQQTHQVAPEHFEKTFNELTKLQQEGALQHEITPEFIIEVIEAEKVYDAVTEVFEELKLELPQEQKEKAFKDLSQLAKANPDLKPADLKDIAREVWGKQKAQNLSRKLHKTGQAPGAKPKREAINPGHEPLTFDDL